MPTSILTTKTTTVASLQENQTLVPQKMPSPELPKGGALIQLNGCGLCGSDLDKVINTKAPLGSVLGHEVVGTIIALDHKHTSDFKIGDRLVTSHHASCGSCHYCLNNSESMCRDFKQSNLAPGGFSEIIALQACHLKHTAFLVPDSITDAEASCMEPLACVVRAVNKVQNITNGSVAVVGVGFIGLMAAQLFSVKGYQSVLGFDLDDTRLALASHYNFVSHAFNPKSQADTIKNTLQTLPTQKVDTVFLSIVNAHTLTQAFELVRDGGRIVLFTSSQTPVDVDPNALYFREITLIPSYSPSMADLKEAADLIFTRTLNVAPLVTHQKTLSELNEAIQLYQSGEAIKVLITR